MSMKDAGILDGDLVAVHRTRKSAAARSWWRAWRTKVTVKRYRQEGSIVWLLPENIEFEPIRVDLKEEPLLIEALGGCGAPGPRERLYVNSRALHAHTDSGEV